MSRRSRLRRLILRLLAGVVAAVAVAFGLVASDYLRNRPYAWSRTEAALVTGGGTFEGRVRANGGLYLVDLPESTRFRWYIVDPKRREVYAPGRPFQFLGMCRTVSLGVRLRGWGKSETRAEVERTQAGYRVRITPVLPHGKEGPPEEFELRLRAGEAPIIARS